MTLENLFGKPLYEYTDDMAVRDGMLIPFIVRERDTGHRITTNAWHDLTTHHQPHYPAYQDNDFYRFFLAELLPLVDKAVHEWDYGTILKSDYNFNTKLRGDGVLWYVPNERGGVTMMKPEDY